MTSLAADGHAAASQDKDDRVILAAPRKPVIIDGGGHACVRLLLELRSRICGLPGGTVIHLIASDPAAPIDLPAWCLYHSKMPQLL